MLRVIVLMLIEMFDICYNVYQKALKPIYPLLKEIISLIYENILKTIYIRILKTSFLYLYNKFISYKESYKEFDKDEFKAKLINYKNEVIKYFKSNTFEEIISDIKLTFKLLYLCLSTLVSQRIKSKNVKDFKFSLSDKKMYDGDNVVLRLKIVKDNVTINFFFKNLDNDIIVTYDYFENIEKILTDEERDSINDRIYSS